MDPTIIAGVISAIATVIAAVIALGLGRHQKSNSIINELNTEESEASILKKKPSEVIMLFKENHIKHRHSFGQYILFGKRKGV
jgi:hypothetical protein